MTNFKNNKKIRFKKGKVACKFIWIPEAHFFYLGFGTHSSVGVISVAYCRSYLGSFVIKSFSNFWTSRVKKKRILIAQTPQSMAIESIIMDWNKPA